MGGEKRCDLVSPPWAGCFDSVEGLATAAEAAVFRTVWRQHPRIVPALEQLLGCPPQFTGSMVLVTAPHPKRADPEMRCTTSATSLRFTALSAAAAILLHLHEIHAHLMPISCQSRPSSRPSSGLSYEVTWRWSGTVEFGPNGASPQVPSPAPSQTHLPASVRGIATVVEPHRGVSFCCRCQGR